MSSSNLLKSSLVRVASISRIPNSETQLSDQSENSSGRAFQIIEVNEWLENTVDCAKWFSSKSRLSHEMLHNFAEKIALNTCLPCVGIIRQMIRHSERSTIPALRNQLNDSTLTMSLSASLWITCTATFEELLVFLYGLYDSSGNDLLDKTKVKSLLSDLFVENFTLSSSQKGNQMIRVEEVLDELFEYSEAMEQLLPNTARKLSVDSVDSLDSVANRFSPVQSSAKIGCKTFVNFMLNRRKAFLWPLSCFQQKLQEVSFGFGAWKVVRTWARKQNPPMSLSHQPNVQQLHKDLLFEVARYMSTKTNIPFEIEVEVQTSSSTVSDVEMRRSTKENNKGRSHVINDQLFIRIEDSL